MFNSDNYSNDGINYNYDALNSILAEMLGDSTDADDKKNCSDAINNALREVDGKIYYDSIVVGVVSDSAQ